MAPATKKATATKFTSPHSTVHPPYLQMIGEAITSLKDRTGSSQPAIAKFVEEKHGNALPPNFRKMLSVQLKKFVKSEKLVKISNSYKLSASEKAKLVAASASASVVGLWKRTDVEKVNRKRNAPKKAEKTRRLSQVKTPEALKKAAKDSRKAMTGGKMKPLSHVKTPEGLKKTKASKSVKSSRLSSKKARE